MGQASASAPAASRKPVHARFAKVLRSAPMLVWMADAGGGVIFVNRKWLTFTGRRLRDELGDGWADSVHADDRAGCIDAYRDALRDRRPFTLEYRLRRADGVFRWISDSALPLHEADGAFAGFVGTCVDVTGQREGTSALARTVEHLRLVAVNADEMIYRLRVGPPMQVEYVSPGVSRIIGVTPEEFIRAPDDVIERLHPDDRGRLRDLLAAPPDASRRTILRWRHPDGRIVWAEHQRLPAYDGDGNLIAIDGVARDVTRQKALERERDAQIALLHGLIAHMSDGVLAENEDGSVAVVNSAFHRLFGIAEHELPGALASLRPRCLDRLSNPGECCPTPGQPDAADLRELRLNDGRTLEQKYFTVRLEDARVIHMWQFRDVTARKREEEQLRTSQHRVRDFSAHLESAREQERRDLARVLHDEVGQLLTGIRLEVIAAVENFRRIGARDSFPVVDRLQAAVGLVDLSIATVQRITTSLRPAVLDHLGIIAAIRWEAAVFERRTGIRCRVSASPARIATRQHITVLYRILLEALTNVARHAQAGTVWIKVRQRATRISMEVRDNGRGIEDEAIDNPTTMGLLGIRERALAAGGDVRISRVPAGGTRVVVTLPLAPEPDAEVSVDGADA